MNERNTQATAAETENTGDDKFVQREDLTEEEKNSMGSIALTEEEKLDFMQGEAAELLKNLNRLCRERGLTYIGYIEADLGNRFASSSSIIIARNELGSSDAAIEASLILQRDHDRLSTFRMRYLVDALERGLED